MVTTGTSRGRLSGLPARLRAAATWIADHELILLALLAPILLFPAVAPPLAVLALACIPVLWLARWLARGQLSVPTPLDWMLTILLALIAVGVQISVVPALAVEKGAGLVLGLAVYYAIVNNLRRESSLWLATGGLIAVGALLAIAGIFGTSWWVGKTLPLDALYERLPRLITFIPRSRTGGFHPNEIGGALAMVFPPALAVWLAARRDARLLRLLGVPLGLITAILVLIGIVLLLVQSRGAWLGVAGVLALGAALRWRWLAWAVVILAIIACGVIAAAVLPRLSASDLANQPETLSSNVVRLVMDMDNLTRPRVSIYVPNWLARIEIWRNVILATYDYPFTGVGLAALPQVSYGNYVHQLTGPDFLDEMTHAHNIYLQAAADFGVLGLVAFLALLIAYLAVVRRSLRALSGEQRLLVLGLTGGLLAYFLHGLVDAIDFGAKPGLLLWAMFGLGVAAMRRAEPTAASGQWAVGSQPAGGRALLWGTGALILLATILLPARWWPHARLNQAALSLDQARLLPDLSPQERAARLQGAVTGLETLVGEPALRPGATARRLGMAYWILGKTDAAQAAFRSDPLAPAYLLSQGALLSDQPGQAGQALAFYRMASQIDPKADAIYCRLSGGLLVAGGLDAGDQTAEPDAEVLAHCHETLGQSFMEQNRWSEAILEFQRAAEILPDSAAYQEALGLAIYRARGDLSLASMALQRAADLDPASMWPCLILSQMRREQGLLDEAIAWADCGAERAPNDPTPLIYRAQALLQAGKLPEVDAAVQAALALNPRLVADYFTRTLLKTQTGDPDGALADYERAVELEPNNVGFRLGLGDAYLARGRRAEAVAAYQAILRLDANNPAARQKLAALGEQ